MADCPFLPRGHPAPQDLPPEYLNLFLFLADLWEQVILAQEHHQHPFTRLVITTLARNIEILATIVKRQGEKAAAAQAAKQPPI